MVYAFLDNLSSYAIRVIKCNKLYLKDKNKNKNKNKNKYQFFEVPIIGFNSAKFDINLLVKYLSGNIRRLFLL
jgi:hypothetical protein